MSLLGILSGIASVASALNSVKNISDSHENMKNQRNYFIEQQKLYKQQLDKAESEQKKQKQKQKDLQDNYRNMKTNLYSEDINGIASNQLIQ